MSGLVGISRLAQNPQGFLALPNFAVKCNRRTVWLSQRASFYKTYNYFFIQFSYHAPKELKGER